MSAFVKIIIAVLAVVCLGQIGQAVGPKAALAVAPKAAPARVQQPVAMSYVRWTRGGFNTVMLLDFVLRNDNDYAVKDLTIKCLHFAPSGTQIDQNSRTLYERLPAHSGRAWQQFNMGFLHSQVFKSRCEVVDYTKETA